MNAKAVFLDRDGTIIEDTGYVGDPDKVKLLPGAGKAIAELNRAGYLVVIISNQSGVARGIFGEDALSSVHQRMESLLSPLGATIDGAYYCPYLDGPAAKVSAYRRDSALRKPKPGLLLQAAEELQIDLESSWMVGDSMRDVQAGKRAGTRTILVETGKGASQREEACASSESPDHVASALPQAIEWLMAQDATTDE